MTDEKSSGHFEEYQRLILNYFERFDSFEKETRASFVDMSVRIATLETELKHKVGLWAAIVAVIQITVGLAWYWITQRPGQ